ncbi:hypothetical protein ACFJGW_05580 [Burkholderiaceae bacterium UC74_6]
MTKLNQTPESTPVELSLEQLAEVSGGTPRQGWRTDPETGEPVIDAVAAAATTQASDA